MTKRAAAYVRVSTKGQQKNGYGTQYQLRGITEYNQFSLEYLLLKSRLYEQGMELHYTDTGLDADDFVGNITGYIKNQAAAEERKKILSRSIEGKCEKAQKLEMGWRFKAPVRLYKSRSEKG